MAKRERKSVHYVEMTDGKRAIIQVVSVRR